MYPEYEEETWRRPRKNEYWEECDRCEGEGVLYDAFVPEDDNGEGFIDLGEDLTYSEFKRATKDLISFEHITHYCPQCDGDGRIISSMDDNDDYEYEYEH